MTIHRRRWFRFSLRMLSWLIAAVALRSACAAEPAAGAEPDIQKVHAQSVAANPQGLRFRIEFAAEETHFCVGELIPLDLVYSFDSPDLYAINDGLALGSGTARLLEVFRVSPETGTRRRTAEEPNFHHWAGGTPMRPQANRVYRYRVYLNEWRRFDAPGKYQFFAISARVWNAGAGLTENNKLRATSNVLELEIRPATTAWQKERLRAAVAVLDHSDAPAERRQALRQLRYLDTEAAAHELARRQTGGQDEESHEIGMALHESRHKAAAVAELLQRVHDEDFAVTAQFFVNLAALGVDAQMPIDYFAAKSEQPSREELARIERERRALEESLWIKYFDAAWTAAGNKPPLARARSMFELYGITGNTGRGFTMPFSPERLASLRAAVSSVFDQLPPGDQYRLLKGHWRQLGGADWLPALRKFVANAPERDKAPGGWVILDFVLERIMELAPKEGAALIQAEIRRETPRATAESLLLLPDKPMPELDKVLSAKLADGFGERPRLDAELAAMLAGRYGSPAIYRRVRKIYGDGRTNSTCSAQAALLAYLLRYNPHEGAELLNQALDARGPGSCYRFVLDTIARVHMSAELERIASERLDEKNPEVAISAARVLEGRGSAAAESALWNAFEKWHDDWQARAGELAIANNGNAGNPQILLESSFVRAIAQGRGWIAGRPKLERLRGLCLTKSAQDQVDRWLLAWREPISVTLSPGADSEIPSAAEPQYGMMPGGPPIDDTWVVAQYYAHSLAEVKSLLLRFPAGTTFSFSATRALPDREAEGRLFGDLQQALAPTGSKLVRPSDEP